MRVEILKASAGYWLVIRSQDQMLWANQYSRLIEALNDANVLCIHVSNIEEFTLSQYKLSVS